MDKTRIQTLAYAVIDTEQQAILTLKDRIGEDFIRACQFMLECEGRIVVTGMGKSGHIGSKIAATLASTGSPAFFVHPGEASHGDLGMITGKDVVLAISNSGETDELLTIVPLIKRLNVPLIAMTGNPASTLARDAAAHLDISVEKEACPLGLAPTASTTATLVMGDALAVALLETRGFTADDFALSHPGGRLGKRLLLHVGDVMHTGDEVPRVDENARLSDALVEMTRKGLGMTAIVNKDHNILGVFTDGDLRRVLDGGEINIKQIAIRDCMTANCKTITADKLAAEALQIMDSKRINALPVVDERQQLIGALNMHDLLKAGVV
ncbi:MAG: KpsF/GutQ family sugar-phosphate isomerase [Gammaproteobacteria bacterium]|nr:KpsF/GutQ family sugar-phosphate isomerase [Gammaproteobacteria bacterium]MDH5653642.1 KpsF/GutQ family sugar-phosphate isomerase [Gammaproteobacteria bacterium]